MQFRHFSLPVCEFSFQLSINRIKDLPQYSASLLLSPSTLRNLLVTPRIVDRRHHTQREMLSSNRRNRLGFGAFAALLLCVGIPVVQSRHSASVRDERTLYGHRQLNEAPLLLRVYDEAWKLAAGSTLSSGESVTTLETTCKKRKSGKGKGKKGGKGNKGSGPDDIVREPVGGKARKEAARPTLYGSQIPSQRSQKPNQGKVPVRAKVKRANLARDRRRARNRRKANSPTAMTTMILSGSPHPLYLLQRHRVRRRILFESQRPRFVNRQISSVKVLPFATSSSAGTLLGIPTACLSKYSSQSKRTGRDPPVMSWRIFTIS